MISCGRSWQLANLLFVTVLVLLHHSRCLAESWRTITISADLSEDVKEFPTLIRLSDEKIFANSMTHGEDLAFLDQEKNRLPFEIVSWDPVRCDSEIWVRVPVIRAAVPAKIYLRYGAKVPVNARFNGYRASDVWADDFDLVLHADDTRHRVNSSAGISSGRAVRAAVSSLGVVGESYEFDGANSFIELTDLQHVDHWMTPNEKLGEYAMRRPQGMANDGRYLYFASHNDPKPADILKISIKRAAHVETFRSVGPFHSAGGDFWGKNRTLVFSTGGNTTPAGIQEITLGGQPIRYWDLSKIGYGTGSLAAWKNDDRWLLLTSSNSRFKFAELELKRDGSFSVIDQWEAPVSLGIPQGMDYFDGHIYYYTDGGTGGIRSPALITKLSLDPNRDDVQYVDQYALLIDNHEAEGLTILDNGTVFVGDVKQGGVGEIRKVGHRIDDFVSTFKDFTVSLWFKQSKQGATKYPTLISKGSFADNRNAFIIHTMDYAAGALKVKFGMTAPRWFGIVSAPVKNDSWHHAVGVYDHAAGVEFYLDGALVGTRPHSVRHTVVDHRVPATIGVDIELNERGHFFPGLIDEIRISKVKSSASRIKMAYQNIARYDDVVKVGPEQTASAD